MLDSVARVEEHTFEISHQFEDHRAVRVKKSNNRRLTLAPSQVERMVEISRRFVESAHVREGDGTVDKEGEVRAESEPGCSGLRILANERESFVGTRQRLRELSGEQVA